MPSGAVLVLLAVIAQGVLTLVLLLWLSYIRVRLLRQGRVHASDVRLSREPWPDIAKQASNAFDNQFQLPVIMYAAAALAYHLGPTVLEITSIWVFASSRWLHAAAYVSTNHVPTRATFFSVGFAALIVLWIELGVRVAELSH